MKYLECYTEVRIVTNKPPEVRTPLFKEWPARGGNGAHERQDRRLGLHDSHSSIRNRTFQSDPVCFLPSDPMGPRDRSTYWRGVRIKLPILQDSTYLR